MSEVKDVNVTTEAVEEDITVVDLEPMEGETSGKGKLIVGLVAGAAALAGGVTLFLKSRKRKKAEEKLDEEPEDMDFDLFVDEDTLDESDYKITDEPIEEVKEK